MASSKKLKYKIGFIKEKQNTLEKNNKWICF